MKNARRKEVVALLRRLSLGGSLVQPYRLALGDAAAQLEQLHAALEGIRPFVAEDFPEKEGEIDWNAYPVSFGYAKAYRALLVALGRIAP